VAGFVLPVTNSLAAISYFVVRVKKFQSVVFWAWQKLQVA
jgi:hypothetical protein